MHLVLPMRSAILVVTVPSFLLGTLCVGCAARPTPEAATPLPVVVETTPGNASSAKDVSEADRAELDRKIAENAGVLGALQELQDEDLASVFGTSGLTDDEGNALGGLIGDEIGEAFGAGGLGLVGTGPGGGGSGEGIGLGSIGTIGHGGGGGSGYGTGVGSLGGSRSRPPRVRMGATTVSTGLAPEIVQRIVRQHFSALRSCYETGLAADPKLEGRLVVDFVIAGDGAVSSATASESTGNSKLDGCAVKEFEAMTFPVPKGGAEVKVKYPIVFVPGDRAASKTKAAPAPPATK